MFQLKPITAAGIPAALHKAERYRLLNDSACAESICLDILAVEEENQSAIVMLLLTITDQFASESGAGKRRAQELLPRIRDAYKRSYYSGIVLERWAKAQLQRGLPNAAEIASDAYHDAMEHYETAERLRPEGNDEAILRWNTCARMLARHERPRATFEEYAPALED
ncbi:MAG TPA: hypothetical protein VHM30_08815 [Gemmatimonadaceae bacterium]|nr:hypothetical protein [Gemmatimonadaceae bacterium]